VVLPHPGLGGLVLPGLQKRGDVDASHAAVQGERDQQALALGPDDVGVDVGPAHDRAIAPGHVAGHQGARHLVSRERRRLPDLLGGEKDPLRLDHGTRVDGRERFLAGDQVGGGEGRRQHRPRDDDTERSAPSCQHD
jgi:hypothetical protein